MHGRRRRRQNKNRQSDNELADNIEGGGISKHIETVPDAHLNLTAISGEFTLFFFADSTNRQSLLAIPIVSKWFHYSLHKKGITIHKDGDDGISYGCSGNKIICVPNHPSTSSATEESSPMLHHTGFYQLPFHHSTRLPLLHMLGATRVPSLIVVRNDTGRIVTRYGWEAVEREGGAGCLLENWLQSNHFENKKFDGELYNDEGECDDNEGTELKFFESQIVHAWRNGESGLPLWWRTLSWIF